MVDPVPAYGTTSRLITHGRSTRTTVIIGQVAANQRSETLTRGSVDRLPIRPDGQLQCALTAASRQRAAEPFHGLPNQQRGMLGSPLEVPDDLA
jgi:hypothetical protein